MHWLWNGQWILIVVPVLQLEKALEEPSRRRAAAEAITLYCTTSKHDFQEHVPSLLTVCSRPIGVLHQSPPLRAVAAVDGSCALTAKLPALCARKALCLPSYKDVLQD